MKEICNQYPCEITKEMNMNQPKYFKYLNRLNSQKYAKKILVNIFKPKINIHL